MSKRASRSCCEKTSNATIVWVRFDALELADVLGHHARELVVLPDPHDRDEVPLAGDRVGLGDAVEVGEHTAQLGRAVRSASMRTTAWVDSPCVSPGSRMTTCDEVEFSTSALNCSASVSIGGNVS